MANKNTVSERTTLEIRDFGSLDRQSPVCGLKQAWVLRNLRPMSDGSLLRREGYEPMLSLEGEVRGVFFAERGGVREGYAVAGETVYALREQDGAYTAVGIGSLTTQTGRVHFMRHDGSIVLMDGAAMYSLEPSGLSDMRAYVPLYGKDWDPVKGRARPVYEQPNLLTRQLRLRYLYESSVVELFMDDLAVESVDAVLVNGSIVSQFRYNASSNSVSVLGPIYQAGTRVDVFVTVSSSFFGTLSDTPLDAGELAMIGDAEQPRAVFFGGNLPTGKAWVGRETDPFERAYVRKIYPDACTAYVTAEDFLMLGDGLQTITGACRHYDRSLIFTSDQAWMADGSTGTGGLLRFIPVNTSLGCEAAGACAVIGNHPYTLHRGRVLRWNSRTDERDECNAEVVSSALGDDLISRSDQLIAHPTRRELWVYTPRGDGALVMREDGAWTIFDGFSPDGMFAHFDTVGFFAGQVLYRFDKEAHCDVDATGAVHPIEAEYQGRYMDFGQAGRMLRLCGVTLVAECGDQEIEIGVQDVRGRKSCMRLQGTGDEISVMRTGAHSGRFRYLRFLLRGCGEGRLRLYGLSVTVR